MPERTPDNSLAPDTGSADTGSASTDEHRAAAPASARLAVVTISDTRTPDTDQSGQYLMEQVKACGHHLIEYQIVKDDAVAIRSTLVRLLRTTDLVITTGGTGISGRDVTIPVIESLIVKPIPGFGELFRMLSYQQVRGAAMLSRAMGGVGRGALLFALPGSLNAVQMAWEGILRDEVGHLVFEVMRHGEAYGQVYNHLHQSHPVNPEVRSAPEQGHSPGLGRHAKD